MKKLIQWLNESFAPKMGKFANNIWVMTIKDSIMQTLPFIFLGSIFCCLTILENYVSLPFSFWTPFGWTMSKISLLVAFLIPFNYMEKKRFRKQRFNAAMTGLIMFLIVISPQVVADGTVGFGHDALGAGGMFVAMFTGIFTSLVMGAFAKFSFFKEDSVIPDFVRAWFDSMLPIGICVCTGWIVVLLLNVDLYNIILSIFMPLASFIQTPFGFMLIMFIYCFLYSMGISSWVLNPVTSPVFLAAITANVAMAAAGTATASSLNLVTSETIYSAYMWVGGIGCTLPLVIMMIFAKSKRLKALGTACFVPDVFNINEPVVFGAIAWNPLLMIPMWLQGIIIPLIVYIFTKVIVIAPIPQLVFSMWYCPYPISTWITTQSVTGLILLAIVIVVSSIIWYPFFKVYDKQEADAEAAKAAESK